MEGRTSLLGLLKSWIVSYASNLFGAILLVWMMLATDVYDSSPVVRGCWHTVAMHTAKFTGDRFCSGAHVQENTPQLGRCARARHPVQLARQRAWVST